MTTAAPLAGKTIIMSGGSRGIGLAIALRAARDGANLAIIAKTTDPHPKLEGTIHTAAAEIEAAGGTVLAIVGDVRDEASVQGAVDRAVERFGGIDICVNNASALAIQGTEELSVKKFDLMQQIQLRGTFLLTRACLPHLRKARNPHVLTLSPPINLAPRWMGPHPAYTLAKYGMTLLALGWAAEYAEAGVASNTLWPESIIATAAVQNLLGGQDSMTRARTPEIMADAAMQIVSEPARECTGNTFIDVDVLRGAGVTDLSKYGGGEELLYDLYVDPPES
jgi:NAD(P)-dependent dehydrogenase (short-subunit alcohol dehydrogenase family)